ncbi:MAG: hypothetical protein V7640_2473 [Betaproteobacteria bacterium]
MNIDGRSALVRSTCVLAALAFALMLCSLPKAHAQSEAEHALEHRVKAAYLYRFTDFITWPDANFGRSDAPFVITVVGRDVVAEELRSIVADRLVAGHPIEVRRGSDSDAVRGAHMIFFADTDRARLRELIRIAPRTALIVTETDGALAQGSVINFVVVEGRVRFEISLESAERRNLRLSSRLLAVAHAVRAGGP